MPIPKPTTETQREYISKCISAISNEYDRDEALAIRYPTWKNSKS